MKNIFTIVVTVLGLILNIVFFQTNAAFADSLLPWPTETHNTYKGGMSLYDGHNGMDINAPSGSVLYSPVNGTATYYQRYRTIDTDNVYVSYGNYVEINSKDGRYTIMICHMSRFTDIDFKVNCINAVDYWPQHDNTITVAGWRSTDHEEWCGTREVSVGDIIGYSGGTGRSTGPHLHVTLYVDGNLVEPIDYFDRYTCAKDLLAHGSEMTSGYDQVLPNGDYIIATACTSDKTGLYYLDIYGSESPAATGTSVFLHGPVSKTADLEPYDAWTISYSNGFYTIKQKNANVALDMPDFSTAEMTGVKTWTPNGSSAQQWAISLDPPNGYRIQAKCSGMSLDVDGGVAEPQRKVQQYPNNESDAQRWLFIPYRPQQKINNGRYILLSGLSDHAELDVNGDTASIPENEIVQIWSDSAPSQFNSFDLTRLSNGYYKIKHAASGKCLDVLKGISNFGQQLTLHTDNGSLAQQWAIIDKGNNRYAIVSRCNGLALDVNRATTTNGTQIIQYPYHDSLNQQWKFVQAEHTVKFDAGSGGSNAPNTQIKYYKNALTLSTQKPSKANYSFKGWALRSNPTKVSYQPGDSYIEDADLDLVAVWKDTDAPEVTGGNLEILSDKLCRFTINASDKVGVNHIDIHTWYNTWTAAGETIYKAQKSGNSWYYDIPYDLKNGKVFRMDARVFDAAGNQALDASGNTMISGMLKYEKITFETKGVECSETDRSVLYAHYNIRGKGITPVSTYGKLSDLPTPTNGNVKFAGWSKTASGEELITSASIVNTEEDHTLYAIWEIPEPDLTLPAALTTIESEAFAGGGFASVLIPPTVKTIAPDAFGDRTDLIILGTSGSYAETFAGEKHFTFVPAA